MTIAFLGTGLMGFNMARRLLERGFTVTAWNRTLDKAKPLEQYGAKVVADLREAIKSADLVAVMLSDDVASERVLRIVLENSRPATTVVNHSTVTPSHSRSMYERAHEKGLSYVSLPVMGGPKDAVEGNLIGIAGGDIEALEKTNGYSAALFKKVHYVGSAEQASAVKLALNSVYFSAMIGLAEATLLSEAWGVSHEVFFKIARDLWISPIVERYGERLLAAETPVSFKLRLAAKDMVYATLAGAEQGVSLPHISAMAQILLLASRKKNLGEEDYSRVYRFLLEP